VSEAKIMEALDHFAKALAILAQAGASQDVQITTVPGAFNINDAAKYIGVSRAQIYILENQGHINRMRGENPPRFSRKALDRYIEKRE
jgi:hypothetical protein